MTFYPSVYPAFELLAATPIGGFALENGTPSIVNWTAPDDGRLHRILVISSIDVTSAETGGQVWASGDLPDGTGWSQEINAGGAPAGYAQTTIIAKIVDAGKLVNVYQASALTVGAATVWAEIWGS